MSSYYRRDSSISCYPPSYEHLLECNGQTIDKDKYADLVAVLGSNVLPNLNGRVLQGSSEPNKFIEAGLPNIYGWMRGDTFDNGNGGAAIFWERGGCIEKAWIADDRTGIASYPAATNYNRCSDVVINASLYDSTYGNSNTVQPPAYTVKYYICYGD